MNADPMPAMSQGYWIDWSYSEMMKWYHRHLCHVISTMNC